MDVRRSAEGSSRHRDGRRKDIEAKREPPEQKLLHEVQGDRDGNA